MIETDAFLSDPRFDVQNHLSDPFGPIAESEDLRTLLDVDGWECSVLDTDSVEGRVDIGAEGIEWRGDYPVPPIADSTQTRVRLAYSESTPQYDVAGTELAPGYELMGYAFAAAGEEPIGYIHGQSYTNLARGVYDAVTMLAHIGDGIITERTTDMRAGSTDSDTDLFEL